MNVGAFVASAARAIQAVSRKARPVFIVGCGRSGTHLLARSLSAHPLVRARIETEPIFGLSTAIALNAQSEKVAFEHLVRCYRAELRRSRGRIFLDKSHPNIWIAEKLKSEFPESRFIGIERNAYATVASMLKHRGVLEWHARWKEFPVPNRFLGIAAETASRYEGLPLASKCALRWVAHRDRLAALRRTLGEEILVLSFEQLSNEPSACMRRLQLFLNLDEPVPVPRIDRAPLTKWLHELSSETVEQIREIVGDEARSAAR
jgi:hypothetical protein